MSASPDVFAHLTHLLMNLAGGKLCAVLEVGLAQPLPSVLCDSATLQRFNSFYFDGFFPVSQGGYNLTSLPQSVCQTVQTLLGDPAPPSANLTGPCRRSLPLYILIPLNSSGS